MANTATRLFNLILLLQRKPRQSAAQLAHALDVSVRTVQRYIAMLEDMGVPVYAERGAQGGYSLVQGYRMPPLMFAPEEAVAIYLGTNLLENVWGKFFRSAAISAMTKIVNVLPAEQLREVTWAKSSLITQGLPPTHPSLDSNILANLYQAARQCLQVELSYRGRLQQGITQRRLDPYALVYSWGHQYCIGYCHLRNAIRSFRVDRIQTLNLLPHTFSKPEHFNPSDHLSDSQFQHLEVQLRFPAESAVIARDHGLYWDSFHEQPDGSVITSFKASDLKSATQRVMCFATYAKVIAPEALRGRVRKAALAVAAQYAPEPEEPAVE